MRVIGINGKLQHGKDTLGKAIIKDRAGVVIKFADALKDVCKIFNGVRGETVEEKQEYTNFTWEGLQALTKRRYTQEGFMTVGEWLQVFGTDVMRAWLEDVWLGCMWRRIIDEVDRSDIVVVTDMRFPNEFDFLKSRFDASLYRIYRPRFQAGTDRDSSHPSETSLDHHKMETIVNDSLAKVEAAAAVIAQEADTSHWLFGDMEFVIEKTGGL